MDMVEKVASAIAEYTYATTGGKDDCAEFSDMPARVQDIYRDAARAAIEAMREPSEEQIVANVRVWLGRRTVNFSDEWRFKALKTWEAMIDSALTEAPTPSSASSVRNS